MRILVVHAWLRGNLGDVLQLSVLLRALRELSPTALDLAGYPPRPAPAAAELLDLADRFVAEPFVWYWKCAPRPAAAALIEPRWRRRRAALFSSYDVIVCAPGPYLAAYDARAPSALSDISIASGLGLRVVLSSHSIGPLSPAGLGAVRRATCIAREPSTYAYLRRHGVACTKAADLAFLYPFERARAGSMSDVASPYLTPYRLAFLRSNNIRAATLRLGEDGALRSDGRTVVPAGSGPLILATSDDRRDRRFVNGAARRLGVASVVCRTVAELVQLVERASLVVSDRYHPAICAAVLGVPATVLPNREPHKMQGLGELLADRGLPELQALARNGLEAVRAALRQVA